MKKVGIVPSIRLFADDDLYNDRYTFVNNYAKRIAQNGGIPIGVVGVDGFAAPGSLEACDCFCIAGGGKIWPLHFQVVEYAVKHRKPLLGICLGAQAISSYFAVAEEAERRGYTGELLDLYETMKKERYMFVRPVEHHWDVHMIRGREDESKHPVIAVNGTRYADILGQKEISGATMHNYAINELPSALTASGFSKDGVIEAVEYQDYILGVQYHPEVDASNDALFRWLCEE